MWNSCSSGGLGHPQARMGGPRGVLCGTYWMTVSSVPARILWFEPAWAWCSRRGRNGILMLGMCCALAANAGLLLPRTYWRLFCCWLLLFAHKDCGGSRPWCCSGPLSSFHPSRHAPWSSVMISNAIISMLFKTKKKTALDNASDNPGEDFGSSLDKHQLRRAQVRKAQTQHRQRKANYVKQLEIDVARIRELITNTQREAEALKKENDSIRIEVEQRSRLQTIAPPLPFLPAAAAAAAPEPAVPLDFTMVPTLPLTFDDMEPTYPPFNELTMSLTFDDVLNAPTFRIKNSSSSSSSSTSNRELSPPSHLTTPEPTSSSSSPPLDPTEEAINFILAYAPPPPLPQPPKN